VAGLIRAFTLRKENIPKVKAYIEDQKERHAVGNVWEKWEQTTIPDDE
jgi:hypothetical protein